MGPPSFEGNGYGDEGEDIYDMADEEQLAYQPQQQQQLEETPEEMNEGEEIYDIADTEGC